MSQWGAGPADAGTVQIRVQVVDVDPAGLDMIVPTYIAAKDLSQRIARDANLGAYWPDGTRRAFWIRARGRILGEEEKLDSLGVVNGELIHVLPQPPANSGVVERPPEMPLQEESTLRGMFQLIRSGLLLFVFAILWAVALSAGSSWYTILVPALGLGLCSTTTSRHFFGPPGASFKIPLVGLVLLFFFLIVGCAPLFFNGETIQHSIFMILMALFSGITGVIIGWLAWYGAVEPLPKQRMEQMVQQIQEVREAPCGICQQMVDLANPDIRLDRPCCGQVFHSGCYRARAAVTPEGICAYCGYSATGGAPGH